MTKELIEKIEGLQDDGGEGCPWSQEELDMIVQALRSSPAGYERGLEDAAKLVEGMKMLTGCNVSLGFRSGYDSAQKLFAEEIRALKGQCHSEALAPADGNAERTRSGVFLCNKHGGYGFTSDCEVCKSAVSDTERKERWTTS